ncbi:FO synthase [Monoraphidium neglectum]|uniref:FO synthase n=1 Tax=Monoraphidium neglectum TaxID=145388 RepID=A0A0D2MJ40_9CHLO|nr:FO synthase [Monoraphidium neglectum]KIY95015.1 FO synthase [Monoraphidium neglectum]|eukprot:XP_013894035.1 FO synthase [Monoraphidium neglectum]
MFKLQCGARPVVWMGDPSFSSCNAAAAPGGPVTLPAYLFAGPDGGKNFCGAPAGVPASQSFSIRTPSAAAAGAAAAPAAARTPPGRLELSPEEAAERLAAPLSTEEASLVDSLLARSAADLAVEARRLRDRGYPRIMTFSPKGCIFEVIFAEESADHQNMCAWAARRGARRGACRALKRPRAARTRAQVFIPLTRLCRDACGYCTFARPPVPGRRAYMTLDEVIAVARLGAAQGCCEALFTLGRCGGGY